MIIRSLLDTDFYKFTMQQLVFHRFADAQVEYQFFCRTEGVDFSACIDEIQAEVDAMCQLRFSAEDLGYLQSLSVFKADYLEFLKTFQLNTQAVTISGGKVLAVTIKGSWVETILFEIPLLSIINEVYFKTRYPETSHEEGHRRLESKIRLLKTEVPQGELKFADFGSRRRFSGAWQQEALTVLQQQASAYLTGTSNVSFASALGLKPIGTMAHEYIQAMQVLAPNLRQSQRVAFAKWLEEYDGQLGIALTDTYTTKVFLEDFDKDFCLAFQGVRQDSGDPFVFAERFIRHLQRLGIDPKTKTIVFSDSLTFPLMIDLYKTFASNIQVVFGIGTNLLNDMGFQPLNIVIKMTKCNGLPVAKISNNPEKLLGLDSAYLQHLRLSFGIKDKAA